MGSGARLVSVDETGLIETDQLRDRQSPGFIPDYRETDWVVMLQVHSVEFPMKEEASLFDNP